MRNIYHKLILLGGLAAFSACEKDLQYTTYGNLADVVNTTEGAVALVNAAYTGLAGGPDWQGGWDAGTYAWRTQAMMTTDEGVCSWGGDWIPLRNLNYTPDFGWVTHNYERYTPFISRITIALDKMQTLNVQEDMRKRYIGELKALRAHYAQLLYFNYGPFTIITDAKVALDPNAPYVPRPTKDVVVAQIEKDYKEAAAVLPDKFTGTDYGRFSKAAALTGLMKLYMHEKRWTDAVTTGQQLTQMGYSLLPNYENNFTTASKGGASTEMILAVVCSAFGGDQYSNMWLAHALPADYQDSTGIPLTAWGGYKMPWSSYDKFDKSDKRLKVLLESYPVGKDATGKVIYKNARTSGALGAIPVKFGPDPSRTNAQNSAVDFPIYRYADVLLMLAESINEANGAPNQQAYDAINAVRARAGLAPLANLSKADFLAKIQDERLFELWGEGWRKDDLIRWNLYIQRAVNDGSTTAQPYKVLLPLPRSVITQSGGVIKQNEGYN
ncbi:RagB/SusD family nutrient uptake outer membrane protein [Chitinophaga qingshengii]|uniref:RagB/SusD family nutrient uptake outer membrane protein n=1 Tax=Chitinophaga qingshengii TaxID=1569794 RepID=A0ABR7TFQ5_9BACT|nr:RagB/SusD family nutrient uptake outer membrane protein [Chitinophaga qingshengii]MBC9929198.1 RagB/SusD family nutrient uptake outer membrane protein [Chitinophaga qingshengii]